MGQWQVRGADRTSGHDVGQIYDAPSREAVAALAAQDGMLVESIELLADEAQPPSETLDDLDAALRRETSIHGEPAAVLLDYGNASFERARQRGVPSYSGLLVAGRIIRVFALIYYALGAIAIVFIWPSVFGSPPFGSSNLLNALWPLALCMTAAVLHAGGSACFALRDIARNSWR